MEKRRTLLTQARMVAACIEAEFNRNNAAHVLVTAARSRKGYGGAHVRLDRPTVVVAIEADRKPTLTKVSPRHRARVLAALATLADNTERKRWTPCLEPRCKQPKTESCAQT